MMNRSVMCDETKAAPHHPGLGERLLSETGAARRTVLVVEDERDLLELLSACLRSRGHDVLTASDGEEALRVFSRNRAEIGLVLADIGLPKLGGEYLIPRLRELNPMVKIIAMSGYLSSEIASVMRSAGIKQMIHKPFDIQELLTTIGATIEAV